MLVMVVCELGLWIIGGMLLFKLMMLVWVCNLMLVFLFVGECVVCYDKIYLFVFDNGCESYDEGCVLEVGS